MLRFVEAMDFVDEDEGAGTVLASPFGVGHDLLDLFDSSKDGGEFDELRFRHAGNDFCQRSFAGAGRAPEDERSHVVAFDLGAEGFAGADEVFLPGILVERARAHAVGKGACTVGCGCDVRDAVEEAHGKHFTTEARRHRENLKSAKEPFS